MATTSRGHIQRLPSSSFRVKVYAGTDPVTGKPRLLRQTCPDEVTAAAVLGQLLVEADGGRFPDREATLGQALDKYIEVADLASTARGGSPIAETLSGLLLASGDDAFQHGHETAEVAADRIQDDCVLAGQRLEAGRQLASGRHLGPVNQDRDDADLAAERGLDLQAYPVFRVVYPPLAVVLHALPSGAYDHEHGRACLYGGHDLRGEVIPGPDGVHVLEYGSGAEAGVQPVGEPPDGPAVVVSPVADKDLGCVRRPPGRVALGRLVRILSGILIIP
jgi:hypothetical protein